MSESKKLWGGRFEGKTDPGFAEFNNSYCDALVDAGVIEADEGSQIRNALDTILQSGAPENRSVEDVHSFVEARLIESTGDVGRKLHTGRSRNDQVATDFRLWLRGSIHDLNETIRDTQSSLVDFAEANRGVVIPGYTHLQRAQPVL